MYVKSETMVSPENMFITLASALFPTEGTWEMSRVSTVVRLAPPVVLPIEATPQAVSAWHTARDAAQTQAVYHAGASKLWSAIQRLFYEVQQINGEVASVVLYTSTPTYWRITVKFANAAIVAVELNISGTYPAWALTILDS